MKGNLVILGAKESGTGAALLGKKLGYSIFLSDKGNIEEKYKEILHKENITFEESQHAEDKILEADLVVKSPGIPDTIPLISKLKGKNIEVISEIEFAGRHSTAKMICITGSNGKTTTTLLTHHILKQAGLNVGLAGNVGYSLAAQVAEGDRDAYVVELSSFQLDGMSQFKADVAVITNITPDHLDRYEYKFENYVNSKFRILQNMDKDGLFIYSWDDEGVREKVKSLHIIPQIAAFSYNQCNTETAACMNGDSMKVCYNGRVFEIHKNEISIKGRHNIYNAMAAVLACMYMGVEDKYIREGLKTFPQVEHRLETVAIKGGVTYINDSKATNVDSAWYALDSISAPIIWITGGTDKGNDYTPLLPLVKEKVKVLVCIGVDNQKLIESFSSVILVEDTHSLAEAMKKIKEYAIEGDTVLLSPCCASFDLFKNYEERGRLFKEAVNQL
ncbi:MAG: UDP-N-acetylmuramoyl-L-alanine--D-glutamate ligase [Odoribacter sp.]|nr:UDP-N-acetylmuramoyl-L-alanine--D-glutamate ligase [Odoribacter sp.]